MVMKHSEEAVGVCLQQKRAKLIGLQAEDRFPLKKHPSLPALQSPLSCNPLNIGIASSSVLTLLTRRTASTVLIHIHGMMHLTTHVQSSSLSLSLLGIPGWTLQTSQHEICPNLNSLSPKMSLVQRITCFSRMVTHLLPKVTSMPFSPTIHQALLTQSTHLHIFSIVFLSPVHSHCYLK